MYRLNTSPISQNDRLFITAVSKGETLLSDSVTGFSSIGDIYRHVKTNVKNQTGVIILQLRNSTRGWTQQHTLVMKRA